MTTAGDTQPPDFASNRCTNVWQGDLPQRHYRNFIFKKCATESDVREAMRSSTGYGLWQAAKRAGEDEF